MTPEEFDQLAKSLRHSWESPGLWPSIERRLRRPRHSRMLWLAAAGVAAALSVAVYVRPQAVPPAEDSRAGDPLLTERAMAEAQAAEAAYLRSIEALSRAAAPKLANAKSPLLNAYAEKLRLLDAAIDDLRDEIDRNRFNAHLHLQMAVLYRDKQRTLGQVLHHD